MNGSAVGERLRGSPARVTLIGAPTDVGAGLRGASMGPEALRVAGIAAALRKQGVELEDRGNLAGPGNPQAAPVGGIRHRSEVAQWNRAVFEATQGVLQAGRIPILLGGDHSLAIGSISAVARHCREARRDLRVLWLDAHADVNTEVHTPTGNLHGMPVACLCGSGPDELIRLAGIVPALEADRIRQIGVRSVDAGERPRLRELAMQVYDMRAIDESGMRACMERALAGVNPDTHLHVSLDVDFLDPDMAPGVATPVRGGPTYREAQLCMEMIADAGCLRSLDIVELNPARDVRNRTATLVVELLESLFGKSTLMKG